MIKIAKDKKTAYLTAVFFSISCLLFSLSTGQSLANLDQDISSVVHAVAGGVVTVEARPPESRIPVYPGQELNQFNPVNAVVGSGLLIDSVGHIITILSLVDGYDEFRVVIDGHSRSAELVGIDERFNLAVLKIDSIFSDYLEISPVPPLVGRLAIAYGRAVGRTGFPILGVIAGLRSDGSYLMSGIALPGLLGGGVFDLSGRLIGIITSGSVTGGRFHENFWGGLILLPASSAFAAADRIICCGNHEAGYLGVKTTAIELVSPEGKVLGEGVVISYVEPGSPAAITGLELGDIITRFGVRQVTSDLELQRLVSSASPGNAVEITFIRDQQDRVEEIRLAKYPDRDIIRQRMTMSGDGTALLSPAQWHHQIDSLRQQLARIQKQLELLFDRAATSR